LHLDNHGDEQLEGGGANDLDADEKAEVCVGKCFGGGGGFCKDLGCQLGQGWWGWGDYSAHVNTLQVPCNNRRPCLDV
jgi:hypothetical protein